MFVDFGDVQAPTLATKSFYFMTSLSHQAVIVFFVLSGFLVGGNVIRSIANGGWNFMSYSIARVTRLWVVLLPALLMTLILDSFGKGFFGGPFYEGAAYFHSAPNAEALDASWSLGTFLQNIFFLQTITSPTFGTNGPLWSLANEFWYYVIFPLGFFAINNHYRPAVRLFLLLLTLAIVAALPFQLVAYGMIWLFGYGAAEINHRKFLHFGTRTRWTLMLAALGLFACAVVYSRTTQNKAADFGLALAFTLLILMMLKSASAFGASALSNISFTLYLTHFPALAFLTNAIFRGERSQPTSVMMLVWLEMICLCIVYAGVMYLLFEKRTKKLQAKIASLLGVSQKRSETPDAADASKKTAMP